MRKLRQHSLKLKSQTSVFLFVFLFILIGTVKSYPDEPQQTYQGILGEEIKSTQMILKVKEEEYQESEEPYKDLVERAIKKKADNLFQDGYKYYREKKYEEAMPVFKEALAIYPQHQKSRIYLDKCEVAIEKEKTAEILAERERREKEEAVRSEMIEKVRTKQTKYHYLKGTNLLRNKKYKEAIEEFNKVLLIDPSHAQAKKLLAKAEDKAWGKEGIEAGLKDNFTLLITYIEDNEYRKAEEELSGILDRIEELEEAYKQRTTSLAMSKLTKRKSNRVMNYISEEEYLQAKEEIGGVLKEISDLAREEEDRKKKKIVSEEVNRYFNSVLDLIDEGNYMQAKFELERILEIDPENEEAVSLLERVKEVLIISESE